jgi:hypothetical protein
MLQGRDVMHYVDNVWYDYVPSAANIADLPTRLDAEALLRLERLGPRVPLLLPPAWD